MSDREYIAGGGCPACLDPLHPGRECSSDEDSRDRKLRVKDGLLEFFDSPAFRVKYTDDVLFYNTFNTLATALEVAAGLLHECDVWMTDDGSEALPMGTGANIKRFLDRLPQPTKATQ